MCPEPQAHGMLKQCCVGKERYCAEIQWQQQEHHLDEFIIVVVPGTQWGVSFQKYGRDGDVSSGRGEKKIEEQRAWMDPKMAEADGLNHQERDGSFIEIALGICAVHVG